MSMKSCLTLLVAVALVAAAPAAEPASGPGDAESQGREWAQKLCRARPETNLIQTGVLKIRNAQKQWQEIPVRFSAGQAGSEASSWVANYETTGTDHWQLILTRFIGRPSSYQLIHGQATNELAGTATMRSFAGSDFAPGDFGLEFLYWPLQKVLRKEFHDNCASIVLESTNPQPAPGSYSRVVSRIDEDSGGIMEAKTYDLAGRLLKDFRVKDLKKVNGRWQVSLVIMENVQAGARTQLEFDLKPAD